jgi:osmotically inducible protein OsmC
MAKVLYTASAHVTGGRNGHGATADKKVDVDLRVPVEMGGTGEGTNPEELFAVGYAACFASSIGGFASRKNIDVGEVTVDSKVNLLPDGEGGLRLTVSLDFSMPAVKDRDQAVEMVRGGDSVCPYSNATRGNIPVELLLDGEAI